MCGKFIEFHGSEKETDESIPAVITDLSPFSSSLPHNNNHNVEEL